MITTGDVLAQLKRQLDWRGPGGKACGHIVLSREEAEVLHQRVIELIKQQDDFCAEIDALRARG